MANRILLDGSVLANPVVRQIATVAKRQIETRCPAKVGIDLTNPDYTVELCQDDTLPSETYAITVTGEESVRIAGGDSRGLLYGIGKWLRMGRYESTGFTPGQWQGQSSPAKSWRTIYLATHFFNYYQQAPIEEISAYIEDLALWGMNTIVIWYDYHHYRNAREPEAVAMQQRLLAILRCAKAIGLDVGLTCLANEAYGGSPPELRADFKTGRAIYQIELCPNKPGAMELMLKWFDEELSIFAEVKPDFVAICPYDQGGCACTTCSPWGANGFLKIAQAKAELARTRFPGIKVILHTWLFDYGRDQGEWAGLTQAFQNPPDWCQYIMADSHTSYPEHPLQKGVPGGLPLLNFPEISMWGMHPWGGFGANPLPTRFEGLWQTVKQHVDGGMPYSEGIFEDINKVLCLQWYWAPERRAKEVVEEYATFEYAPEVAETVCEAIDLLEANHGHIWPINWDNRRQYRFWRSSFGADGTTQQAVALLTEAEKHLTPQARAAWRWRILYLRAMIDDELAKSEGLVSTEACERCFEELTEIFHAQESEYKCAPPTRSSILAMRATERKV